MLPYITHMKPLMNKLQLILEYHQTLLPISAIGKKIRNNASSITLEKQNIFAATQGYQGMRILVKDVAVGCDGKFVIIIKEMIVIG